ncbi:MAG: protein kinase [Acidobacteria bacterium]|nr:protein kinase [Acidobacteriota bacterium]
MALTAGTRLGPYEVLSSLGAGGMGEVYRARDTRLKREVALKILPESFATNADRLARFQREAEVLASLNHPNIAAIYGLEESNGTLALVLELVEGDTLADRIARGPLPLDDVLAMARQIADALEAAHEHGVVHRDLKPSNIKVTPAGTVKVLDFGLAKMLALDGPASSRSMSPTLSIQATYAGVILGTVGYMSPEQARGKDVDRRTDIWAFGCVLYEMLTGRQVFGTHETVSDAVAAVLTREPDWGALPWVVTVLALGVVVPAFWSRSGPSVPAASPVRRLEINLPAGIELFTASPRPVAISPAGDRIAFVGVRSGSRLVYVRSLDQFDAVPLRGTDTVAGCFFSPDGRSIGWFTSGGELKTVSLADGLVTTVASDVNFLYGGAWGADDSIVVNRAGALWRIPRTGGTPAPLTMLGGPERDTLHAWPVLIPGGAALLFAAASDSRSRIEALVLATGERRTVVDRGTLPLYAGGGHLVFFRDGELLAAPFDAAALQVTGPAVRVIDNLPASVAGVPVVDVSPAGTMVFAPTTAASRLVWVSRQGAEQPLNDVLRPYANPRLDADGGRVLVEAAGLWMEDVKRATFTRLSVAEDVLPRFPIWAPDGRRVVYRTPQGLAMQDADGTDAGQAIAGTSPFDYPGSVTADGNTLLFLRSSPDTSFDVYAMSLREPGTMRPILNTPAYEGGASLSPDGRWLIHVSNESGQNEVYLRPFPGPGRRWQVSTDGGTQAVWNPNGRELFYRSGDKMMAVEVSTTPDVTLSPPRLLFERRYAYGAGVTIANYDVTRDGQRFIMVKEESNAGRLNVVLNWSSELGR